MNMNNNKAIFINFKNLTRLILVCTIFAFILILKLNHERPVERCDNQESEKSSQLADLSIKLTNAAQKIGKLKCEMAKSFNDVSPHGGWCLSAGSKNSSEHKTDSNFAKALSKFLNGKTVASFGDGPGFYKDIIDRLNQVKLYDAFDGSPYTEVNSKGKVKFLDLSIPIYHLDKYDWILSVEVAEHIPVEFEMVYLTNLIKHAKEGVILSWAKEGQGGFSHVNERNFDYVKYKMESMGVKHDLDASVYLKNSAKLSWIKDNINVFRKK